VKKHGRRKRVRYFAGRLLNNHDVIGASSLHDMLYWFTSSDVYSLCDIVHKTVKDFM
jgi:hypothetical protein